MPNLISEEERLESLRSYNLSDLDRDDVYNDVVNIASLICDAPSSVPPLVE